MTREQAKKNLITFGVVEPTEEQITNYLNQVNGETQKEKDKADKLKEKADKYDEAQRLLEEEQKKNMNADEKLDAAIKEANERALEFSKKSTRVDVEKIFVNAGLSDEDYKEFIDGIVSDNADTSKSLANAFVKTLSSQKEKVVQKTKEDLLNGTGKPGDDGSNHGTDNTLSDAEKIAKDLAKNKVSSKEQTSIIDNYK